MMVAVPVIGKVGDRITPHFRDFGRLDGFVSDTVDGGFLLELDLTKPTREEFASKLFWLLAKQISGFSDTFRSSWPDRDEY
jgi:hypothetical protein